MSSGVLQGIAAVTMVVDHTGMALFPNEVWLRWIGRLSFPLFVFLLTEGFVHTASRKKYLLRLGIFGAISEVPYQLFVGMAFGTGWQIPCQNVFFELMAAFLALWCAEKGGAWLLGTAGLVAAAELLGLDYGAYGILLALCFTLFRGNRVGVVISLGLCTALYCGAHQSLTQAWAILAALPLIFYNGKRGKRLPRYFLYVFYPAHLAVLILIRRACWGG